MRTLPILSERATSASSQLVDCRSCTSCCESGGFVYLTNSESRLLKRLRVPTLEIDGVAFIDRLPDGSCPALDKQNKKCTIYEDRPLCCRLFPLDVLSINGHLQWALSTQCPDDRKHFERLQGSEARVGFGTVGHISSMLGSIMEADDVEFMASKEKVSSQLEFLDNTPNTWIPIHQCDSVEGNALTLMSKKKETEKERLKRKLQEKEKKGKGKKEKETGKKKRKVKV